MTYSSFSTFEFTAFTGDSILDVDTEFLKVGDTISTAKGPNTTFSVRDNDGGLSGDAFFNEIGNDWSGQTADIQIDGGEPVRNQKVYAEEYYVLEDADGNRFVLIEIEVAFAITTDRQDYFTFFGEAPAPGTALTVVEQGNVFFNWVRYNELTGGESAVNTAPVAGDVAFSFDEDTSITLTAASLLANSFDAEGAVSLESLSYSGTDGTLIPQGDTFTFVPNADFNGTVALNLVVRDSEGLTDTATVTLDVTPVKDAPVAADDAITIDENGTFSVNLLTGLATDGSAVPTLGTDTDPDGPSDQLTVTGLSNLSGRGSSSIVVAPNGSNVIQLVDGTRSALVVVGSDGFAALVQLNGFESTSGEAVVFFFDYEITDAQGLTDTATFTLTVEDLARPPVAADDVINTTQFGQVSNLNLITGVDGNRDPVSVLGQDSDIDGRESGVDITSVTVAGGRDAGTLAIPSNGSISFTVVDGARSILVTLGSDGAIQIDSISGFESSVGQDGTFTFSYEITDAQGLTDSATVTVNVADLEDPVAPIAADDVITTDEDTSVSGVNILTGVDTNPVPTSALGADVDPDGPNDQLAVRLVTFNGPFGTEGLVPSATGTSFTVVEGGRSIDVTLDSAGNLSVANITGLDATDDQNGSFTLTYEISDAQGLLDEATVTINVADLIEQKAPIATSDTFTLDENGVLNSFEALTNDTDPDQVTAPPRLTEVFIPTGPDAGTNVIFNQTLTLVDGARSMDVRISPNGFMQVVQIVGFDATEGQDGSFTLDYTLQDEQGLTDTATVTFNVADLAEAPVAGNISFSTDEDTPLTLSAAQILANSSDVGGPVSLQSLSYAGTNGILQQQADTFFFQPNANFNGQVALDLVVRDSAGLTDTATVTLDVLPGNDAPTVSPVGFTFDEDNSLTLTPAALLAGASDVEGPVSVQSLTYSGTDGQLVQQGSDFVFTPNANFNGVIDLDLVVRDSEGLTASTTASLNIRAVNDAPVVTPLSFTMNEDTILTLTEDQLLSSASDVEGPVFVDSLFLDAVIGVVAPDANGFTFTPFVDFNGTAELDLTVRDTDGVTRETIVTVNVLPVNDAPVAQDDTYQITESFTGGFNLISDNAGRDGDVDDNDSLLRITSVTITVDDPSITPVPVTETFAVPATGLSEQLLFDQGRRLFFEIDSVGNFNVVGTAGFEATTGQDGTFSFQYELTDPQGLTDTATVTVNVTDEAPTAPPPVTPGPIQEATSFVLGDGETGGNQTVNGFSFADGDTVAVVLNGVSYALDAQTDFFNFFNTLDTDGLADTDAAVLNGTDLLLIFDRDGDTAVGNVTDSALLTGVVGQTGFTLTDLQAVQPDIADQDSFVFV